MFFFFNCLVVLIFCYVEVSFISIFFCFILFFLYSEMIFFFFLMEVCVLKDNLVLILLFMWLGIYFNILYLKLMISWLYILLVVVCGLVLFIVVRRRCLYWGCFVVWRINEGLVVVLIGDSDFIKFVLLLFVIIVVICLSCFKIFINLFIYFNLVVIFFVSFDI